MHLYAFEKLEVWQDARKFVGKIYKLTIKYPPEEKFVLVSQLRRAAISVSSNIAEGSGRKNKTDQSHFYRTAYSSLLEILNQLIISNDLNYISSEELIDARLEIEKITNKLNRIYQSLNREVNKGTT